MPVTMETRADPGGGRHFSGIITRLVTQYLVATQSSATLQAVLADAGEARPLPELLDDGSWSSYGQVRRLLEAVAGRLGMAAVAQAAPTSGRDQDPADAVAPLLQLGSPTALLDEGVASGTALGMATVVEVVAGRSLGPDGYRIAMRMADGFEPFPELCVFIRGLLSVVPTLFGLPTGQVVEEHCQCQGAETCALVLRWEPLGSIGQQNRLLRAQVHVLEHRLTTIQDMLDELVSTDDVERTLRHVADTAAAALRVPAHVLVLDRGGRLVPVQVVGATRTEAMAAVRRLDPAEHRHALVAEVASSRRRFGRLAVLDPGRTFRPHEQRMLASYAKLAAAALDSATAVAEASAQAATASALLRLSRTLSQVLSADELAQELARALPEVVDCDRTAIVLGDPRTGQARVAAVHGYPDDIAERHQGHPVRFHAVDATDRVTILRAAGRPEQELADLMRLSGTLVSAIVPVMVDERHAGQIIVSVTERAERLTHTPELEERLLGVAGLAATALRNGMLVDAIRHQATHDALTGLPNRALVLDRLGALLSRRDGPPVTVLFVDLDGFKDVNDTLGHGAGDRLLVTVGQRLRAAVRATDLVGRLGGDEFVVLSAGSDPGPAALADRVLRQLRVPLHLDEGPTLTVTASVGIAVGTPGTTGDDGDALLRQADMALYAAKARGKDQAAAFTPAMVAPARRRLARHDVAPTRA